MNDSLRLQEKRVFQSSLLKILASHPFPTFEGPSMLRSNCLRVLLNTLGIFRIGLQIGKGVTVTSFLIAAPCQAEFRTLSLLQPITIADEPDRAVMVVSSRGQTLGVVTGIIIRTAKEQDSFVVGRLTVDRSVESVSVLTAVVGRKGEVQSAVQVLADLEESPSAFLSTSELERDVVIRRKELSDLQVQRERQAANLERLQTDADVIANVGRIVDAEDELGAVKSDAGRLKASLLAARERLASLRSLPAPTNYERREAGIAGYLNDFSKASHGAHGDVLQRLASAEDEMQRKVALIESTKNEHVDLLQKELASLRREREVIERSRTVVVSPPPAEE
jgi:hypothetical protein